MFTRTSLSSIHEKINEGITEKVNETKTPGKGKQSCWPYKPVIRESVETTKRTIVYDALAKPSKDTISLNECL